MVERVIGCFYRGVIDKTGQFDKFGKELDFTVEISCNDGELFKELLEYVDTFKNPYLVAKKNSKEILEKMNLENE